MSYPAGHRGSTEERFWAKVRKTETCWLWTAATVPFGYGHFRVEGKNIRAHRFSWELHNGPVPPGLFICHHCDVSACVNPHHLWVGTNADNLHDMAAKGRHKGTTGLRWKRKGKRGKWIR